MDGTRADQGNVKQFIYRSLRPTLRLGFLCLYAIIIIFLYVYHHHYVPEHGNYVNTKIPELDVANSTKCAVDYTHCEYDRLTGWSIGRFLVFAFVGCIQPDNYMTIFLFSGIMEAMVFSNRGRPKFISNSIMNMLGYTVGSNIWQLARPTPSKKPMFP